VEYLAPLRVLSSLGRAMAQAAENAPELIVTPVAFGDLSVGPADDEEDEGLA